MPLSTASHNRCSSSESQVTGKIRMPVSSIPVKMVYHYRTTLVVQERREHVTNQAVRLIPCYLPRGPIPDQWNTKVSDHERTEPSDWWVEGLRQPCPYCEAQLHYSLGSPLTTPCVSFAPPLLSHYTPVNAAIMSQLGLENSVCCIMPWDLLYIQGFLRETECFKYGKQRLLI